MSRATTPREKKKSATQKHPLLWSANCSVSRFLAKSLNSTNLVADVAPREEETVVFTLGSYFPESHIFSISLTREANKVPLRSSSQKKKKEGAPRPTPEI
jgi:hypothetical protein